MPARIPTRAQLASLEHEERKAESTISRSGVGHPEAKQHRHPSKEGAAADQRHGVGAIDPAKQWPCTPPDRL